MPHDRLFLDALERDLKRERMGTESTTVAVQEPALSFVFDATQSLYEQLTKSMQQTAASEVGASLAAQQAQHNMIAHYQGPTYLTNSTLNSQSGPSYRGRSQSIQSAVPIDYRSQSVGSHKPSIVAPENAPYAMRAPQAIHPYPAQPDMASLNYPDFQNYAMDATSSLADSDPFEIQRSLSFDREATQSFESDHDLDLNQAEFMPDTRYSMSMSMPYHAAMSSLGSESDFQLSMGEQAPEFKRGSFARPYATSECSQNHQAEAQGIFHQPEAIFHGGIPRNFSIFEGSPTYKQRRRRQSIPSSLILAEQAQEVRQRYEHRAATEPDMGDRSKIREMSSNHRSASVMDLAPDSSASLPRDMLTDEFGTSSSLSYQEDSEIAELERNVSRAGSEADYGTPYSTKSYSCPIPSCDRAYKRLEHLKRHVSSHTHERPFVCHVCSKRFGHVENLAQHQLTHGRSESSTTLDLPNLDAIKFYTGLETFPKHELAVSDATSLSNYSDVDNCEIGSYPDYQFAFQHQQMLKQSSGPQTGESDFNGEDLLSLQPYARMQMGGEEFLQYMAPASAHNCASLATLRSASSEIILNQNMDGEITPRDTRPRTTSSFVTDSTEYVSHQSERQLTLESAPRSVSENSWLDKDATPRQERFSATSMTAAGVYRLGTDSNQMW